MIELNGSKFAANKKELEANPDSVGFYRVNQRTVTIQNLQREKVGVITSRGVLASATKMDCGRWWYSYATIGVVGEYDSYTQEQNEVRGVLKRFNIR